MPKLTDLQNSQVGAYGSRDNTMEDPNVMASPAGVITPVYPITRVSGVAAITGITVPYPGFAGRITFIPTGVFTWTIATNIGLAGTAVVGKALDFVYLPGAGKWYPSYIA